MIEIIVKQTGPNTQARLSVNGAGDHSQIALLDSKTNELRVIFTGEKFSQKEYEKQGGREEERVLFCHRPQPVLVTD
jgi:hypothetical protein